MSNSLDPYQDGQFVGPDLGLNCLQRLSSDNKVATSTRLRVIFLALTIIQQLSCPVLKKLDFFCDLPLTFGLDLNIFKKLFECQTVWIQTRANVMSVLI